jgi:hypothetical protein
VSDLLLYFIIAATAVGSPALLFLTLCSGSNKHPDGIGGAYTAPWEEGDDE